MLLIQIIIISRKQINNNFNLFKIFKNNNNNSFKWCRIAIKINKIIWIILIPIIKYSYKINNNKHLMKGLILTCILIILM